MNKNLDKNGRFHPFNVSNFTPTVHIMYFQGQKYRMRFIDKKILHPKVFPFLCEFIFQ